MYCVHTPIKIVTNVSDYEIIIEMIKYKCILVILCIWFPYKHEHVYICKRNIHVNIVHVSYLYYNCLRSQNNTKHKNVWYRNYRYSYHIEISCFNVSHLIVFFENL